MKYKSQILTELQSEVEYSFLIFQIDIEWISQALDKTAHKMVDHNDPFVHDYTIRSFYDIR